MEGLRVSLNLPTHLMRIPERRDLTINAMGMNSSEVIDPQGGLEDLQNGVIRAVGDPTRRFVEDPLRMISNPLFSSFWNTD